MFNPLTHILDGYRAILMHGDVPEMLPLLVLLVVSFIQLRLFGWLFNRASMGFAEEL